jgi:hypothetical protein
MFYGHAGHLDEFYFRHKRMEKKCFDYARNLYHDEFIDFLPHTSCRALPRFFHGPNDLSYGFGSRENIFVPRCLGYGPRPHRGDRPLCSHGFLARGAYSHLEPSRFDSPRFLRRDSCPTPSNGEV